MKKILSVLIMLSVVIVSLGGVLAGTCTSADVALNAPVNGLHTNANSVLLNWSFLNEDCNSEEFEIFYMKDSCAGVENRIVDELAAVNATYSWDVSSLEGVYCVRIESDNDDTIKRESTITIDRAKAVMNFTATPYHVENGTAITTIAADVSDVSLKEYILYFGDGSNQTGVLTGTSATISVATKTYSAEGEYALTLTVTDEAGNVETITGSVVVTSTAPAYVVELLANQANYVSIPVVPEDTSYSEVLAGVKDNLDRVWVYQYDESSKTNKWLYHYVSTSGNWAGSSDFDDIVPGYGYVVFMKSDDVFYGNAKTASTSATATPAIPSSIKLANGYNLVSLFGTATKTTTTALKSLNFNGNSYWHDVVDSAGASVATGSMDPKKAYWASMIKVPGAETQDYYLYYP